MPEEEDNDGNGNCPLSPTDWVMLLSGEIHNCSTHVLTIATVVMACVLACLGGAIADLTTRYILLFVLVVLGAFAGLRFITYWNSVRKIIGELDELREDIIEKRDLDKICGRWKEIHEDIVSTIFYIYPKKRHSGLEKTEMDNANKKSEDGKEDLEKKDIKETLHRIKTKIDEGKKIYLTGLYSVVSLQRQVLE